jgi:Zn-dependent M28 family amino/carboxypeptidase
VAKPPGRDCETVSGGHYDSVPQAPGASDNATGTATVIEIAAVVASRGEMGGNCFVLFGGEELGLLGSRAFVEALTPAQRRSLKAMFNYDMVGVGDEGWLLLGSTDLQTRGLGEARALGISGARGGQLPRNTSSDHASFLAAGIPALMLYRLDDPLLHTPQDVSGRVSAELLEEATRLGVAVLESLARGS